MRRPCLVIALRARMCNTEQTSEHDNVAGCNELRTRIDVADHNDVARVMQALVRHATSDVIQCTGRRRRNLQRRNGLRRSSCNVRTAYARLTALATIGNVGARAGEIGNQRARGIRKFDVGFRA